MNPIDDDTLRAYVDGQLDPAEVARIEAAMANDPALAARVARERALLAALRGHFDPVLDEPVPERLADLLRAPATADAEPAKVVPLPARRSGRQHRARWLVPAALAASVALFAALFWHGAPPPLVRTQDGQSFASGALRRALDTQLASAPAAGAETSVGLTFRDADGVVCRTFVHRDEPAMAGLACRRGDGWSLPVLVAPAGERAGPIRQAASALPPAVQAAVDARIRGDAFDASEERAAREAGWR